MDSQIKHALKTDRLADITTIGRKTGRLAELRSLSITLMARCILAVLQAGAIGMPIWWRTRSSPST